MSSNRFSAQFAQTSIYDRSAGILALVAAFTPLVIGGLTYLAFRPKTLLMFSWCSCFGFSESVARLRVLAHPFRNYLPDWFIYSFPQGAWVWFGTMTLLQVWPQLRSYIGWGWVLVPCLLGVGGEIGQGLHLVPGTFDLVDIGFSLLGFLGAFLVNHWLSRNR